MSKATDTRRFHEGLAEVARKSTNAGERAAAELLLQYVKLDAAIAGVTTQIRMFLRPVRAKK